MLHSGDFSILSMLYPFFRLKIRHQLIRKWQLTKDRFTHTLSLSLGMKNESKMTSQAKELFCYWEKEIDCDKVPQLGVEV